ncbi:hypothetical protein [Carboxylicivirga sp. N1Y90]|uniref:hypothetical protein n=1 Tax=Carboxylicivirga fragile TaxID=3417571 RepID=UPI003D3447E1|nr:hypothetical protein [Marinilabiliaceae bacterium N1Y90]
MSQKKLILERYGNLLKQESLVTMDDKILPNTFVLEAPEPFPGYFGYYSEIPSDSKPLYIYLVLNKLYTLEEVTRATQNIKQYFSADFSAASGTINIHNEVYHVIRIRRLDTFDQIQDLQSCYLDEGVELKKKPKKRDGQGIIRLKKFFMLEKIEDGIFFDLDEKDHGYFTIPKRLTWKHFEDITQKVKHNWDHSTFDAALGHIHEGFGVIDMVRIYNPNVNRNYLIDVRKLYLDRIK